MRIGELAAQTTVNVQTIRFYEREGLLRKPSRTPGGYRSYERQDLERVQFIRVCQGLGFGLREVRQLIRLHHVTQSPDHHASMTPQTIRLIVALAQERIASIEEKICTLSRMLSEMRSVVEALSSPAPVRCPASGRPATPSH
jgi:DNA-binding transcriptional MerR regulator